MSTRPGRHTPGSAQPDTDNRAPKQPDTPRRRPEQPDDGHAGPPQPEPLPGEGTDPATAGADNGSRPT
jgi:hypothetical protein